MKRFLGILLLGMMATSLFSNGQQDETASSQDAEGLPSKYDLVISMGGQTGSVYAMGIQIGEYLREIAPGIRTTVKAGSGGTNVVTVNRGMSQIGHTSTENLYAAAKALYPFDEKQTDNVMGVCKVMQNAFHLVVPAKAPFESVEELVEQQYPLKISAGSKGSGIEGMFRKLLAEYGVTYEDIESWGGKVEFLGFSEAVTLYKDGELNALTIASGIPYSHILDVSTSRDVKLLGVPSEFVEKFSTEGYAGVTIPANSYKGQTEDVHTFGAGVVLVANSEANEFVIYEVTKWLNSEAGIELMGGINKGFTDYMKGPETGISGFDRIDLHPGAEKFYREAGVIK